MQYESFEELNAEYPEGRSELGFDDELCYLENALDIYEGIGFAETFESPYEDYSRCNGMKFEVIRRMSDVEVDTIVLPKWLIRVEDGTEIEAYPEEICLAERKN